MVYVLKRLSQTVLSLLVLVTLTFFLMKVFPGSPFDEEATLHPSVQLQLNQQYGLQYSWGEQYFYFFKQLVQGNLGVSQFYPGRDASEVILRYFPVTARLAILALAVAIVAALTLALWAIQSAWGYFVYQAVTLVFLSAPLLLAGPLLIYLLGFKFNLLPVALLEGPFSYIMPVLLIAMRPVASLSRLLFTSLQENLSSEYLRTARAFGFSETSILIRKNLRAALIPFVAHLGPLAALLLAGSVMVEIIFAIPGLGSQFVESVLNRDTTMVIGLTLFYGFFILGFQVVVDLAIGILDPRVRQQ